MRVLSYFTPIGAMMRDARCRMKVIVSAAVLIATACGGNKPAPADARKIDLGGETLLPGFIDTHIHYPQTRVIGSYGAQLLDWLQKYTFVEEQKFSDRGHADVVARFFLDEMFRQGTTTAVVYCTVRPESVDAFFAESERRGARMIAGKCLMDRNAPAALTDTPQQGYDESKALIERWRGRGRLDYAITPRFAITSTDAQLQAAGALAREYPDAFVQNPVGTYGNVGRNAERGPGLFNFDLALNRTFKLSERFRLQARAEAFNILNHTNFVGAFAPAGQPAGASFGTLSTNLSSSNFGQVTGAYDPRILQFAMKVIF